MEVYVEYVLIDNLVINSLLLILTKEILKLKIKKRNLIFSAFLGTAFAFVTPFLVLPNILLFLYKLCLASLMMIVLTKYKTIKQFIVTLLTFFSMTFLFGGLIFSILDVLNAKVTSSGILVYEVEIPIGLIVFFIAVYSYFMMNLIKDFYKKKKVNEFLYSISIKVGQKEITTTAFLDSGNRLTEPTSGKPIIIINYSLFCKIFEELSPIDILMERLNELPFKNGKYIMIDGVNSSKNKLFIFESEEVKIFLGQCVNIIPNVILGLNFQKFDDAIGYDVLLNPLLFS